MNKQRFLSLTTCFTALLAAKAATLTGDFSSVAAGSNVNLTVSGKLDWVHWGLGGDHTVNRKASVTPLIGDFSIVSLNITNNPLSFSSPYWFEDTNGSSCSWSDGEPVITVTNTYTRVLAYSYPTAGGSGFKLTLPADTTTRVLTLYVGTISSKGDFKATLSGAPNYTHTAEADTNGVYTITYAANSPGQILTITWTLPVAQTDGSVTLQAAAVTAAGANNPPFAILTNPPNDTTYAGPTNVLLDASAQDFDGTVTNVSFYANAVKLGQKATAPYDLTWSNAPLGRYLLTTVATDNAGVSRSSIPVEVFVHGISGSQTNSLAFPPPTVDLTVEGTADWVHWGFTSNSSVDRKNGVPAQISNFTPLGPAAIRRYADNYSAFSWSDGTPTSAASGTKTGIFVYGLTNGFSLTAPADTSPRTLRIYVGAYGARGHLLAYLSDFSARPFINSSISDTGWDNEYGVYEINYNATSPGQQMNVEYRSLELFDQVYGNVTLQAATLQGGAQSVVPVYILNPARVGNDFILSFSTVTSRSYAVQYCDQLPAPAWTNLAVVSGDGSLVTVTNFDAVSGKRFYRVQTQ